MGDFAQTREADDLFESEISAPPVSAPTEPRAFSNRGHGGGGGGGGAGGGGGGHGRGGRGAQQQTRRPQSKDGIPPKDALVVEGAPEGPAAEAAVKQQDRTLSGGLKKPKLTDEEMAERMARVKLNDQLRIDRLRKAEEDENAFRAQEEARKQEDATKRFVERRKKVEQDKNRKELDDEREKNRQRKLSAVQAREWDSTKTEDDYNPPRTQSSRSRRGAYGAVSGPPTPPRGAPTGPRRGATGSKRLPSKNSATPQEWPSLPSVADSDEQLATKSETTNRDQTEETTAKNTSKAPEQAPEQPKEVLGGQELDSSKQVNKTITPLSPAVGGRSWAEQVEANI